jgi:hypothetical protein
MAESHVTLSELEGLVMGVLDSQRESAIADHLRSCGTCRALMDREVRLEQALYEIATDLEIAPISLKSRRVAAVRRFWWVPVAAALTLMPAMWLLWRPAPVSAGRLPHRDSVALSNWAVLADAGMLPLDVGADGG